MANGDISIAEIRAAIGQRGANWVADENDIWRLSAAAQLRRLGLVQPMDFRTAAPQPTAPPYLGAPPVAAAFDYRNVNGRNFVTPVRDQGECGACVAFGCLAAMETTLNAQRNQVNPRMDLSEAELFFCYGAADGATCASGWWPERALPHCVTPGIVDEPCFAYVPRDQGCERCEDWEQRLTKIRSFTRLATPWDMKGWLMTKGAIVTGFDVYQDFFAYQRGVYSHVLGSQPMGGHCVAIIGYDDGQQCWICKNSWGPAWGELGFFRIRYGDCRIDSWIVLGVE